MKYNFSVIIPTFNSASYIAEAVDSVIKQTKRLSGIQIIIINDGSTDETEEIIKKYIDKYPENIHIYYQSHGGTSKARNEGIKHIEGEYVTFLDADDLFKGNVFKEVYRFFLKHKEETDVVVVPRYFFGDIIHEHDLNYRFKSGSRVVDLLKEPEYYQNSVSAAFIKKEAVLKNRFSESLKYSEDTLFINTILLNKQKLGILNKGSYQCRKVISNSNSLSATQNMLKDKKSYLDTIDNFSINLINNAVKLEGYVPEFVQNVLLFELKFHLYSKEKEVLNSDEEKEYISKTKKVLSYISDDVIIQQHNIRPEFRYYFLVLKNRECAYNKTNDNIILSYGNKQFYSVSNDLFEIDSIQSLESKVIIKGKTSSFTYKDFKIIALVNNKEVGCNITNSYYDMFSLNTPIRSCFEFNTIFSIEADITKISFKKKIQDETSTIVKVEKLSFSSSTPITEEIAYSYSYDPSGLLISTSNNSIIIEKGKKRWMNEIKFLYGLLISKEKGSTKAIIIRPFVKLAKTIFKTIIFVGNNDNAALISDIAEKGLKYDKKFNVFIVSKNKPKQYFKFSVRQDSHLYKLLYLSCDKLVVTESKLNNINCLDNREKFYRDILYKQNVAML